MRTSPELRTSGIFLALLAASLCLGCGKKQEDPSPPRYPGTYAARPERAVDGATVFGGTIVTPDGLPTVRAWYEDKFRARPEVQATQQGRESAEFWVGGLGQGETPTPSNPATPAFRVSIAGSDMGSVVTISWSVPKK